MTLIDQGWRHLQWVRTKLAGRTPAILLSTLSISASGVSGATLPAMPLGDDTLVLVQLLKGIRDERCCAHCYTSYWTPYLGVQDGRALLITAKDCKCDLFCQSASRAHMATHRQPSSSNGFATRPNPTCTVQAQLHNN